MTSDRKPVIAVGDEEKRYRMSQTDPHELVAHMVPLKKEEEVFRNLFWEHSELNLEIPHDIKDLRSSFARVQSRISPHILKRILSSDLEENSFFEEGMDASIYQHMRYMPAYWHTHTFLEIACAFWGSCTNYVADSIIPMKEGDICILAPGTRHAISAFTDDCILLNLELRLSTFEEAFFGTLEDTDILASFFRHALYGSPSHPYLLFHTPGDFELYDILLDTVKDLSENHLYKRRMTNNLIMLFFTTLLRRYGDSVVIPEIHTAGKNENAFYLLQYMQQHYKDVTLSELAEFFGYSERQVQRLITQLTGKSFIRNIQDMKLRRAADLLSETDRPLAEIIEDLGWSDPGNFRTLFRRRYGMTPSEYRKVSKQQEKAETST